MKETLKRYAMALFFLLLVIILMLLGTLGVKKFEDHMFKNAHIIIKPKGEKINL